MDVRTIHLILIVSADPDRLQTRHAAMRRAGYHALPAPTIAQALTLARKVRPSVVLADVVLADGRAPALVQALRAVEALRHVHVIVLGVPTVDEEDVVARDARTRVHQDADEATLLTVLESILAA